MGQDDTTKTTTGAPDAETAELLLRQVKNKVDQEGKNASSDSTVAIGKMLGEATCFELFKIIIGWICAAATGACLPMFFFYLGPIFDEFGQGASPEEQQEKVRELCAIMGGLTGGIIITSFLQNYLLLSSSASVAARMKTRYLKKILDQESAWFDQCNYMELSARMSREISQIQAGIGAKIGQFLYALFMSLGGLVVGFYKGWSLTLAMFAIGPIMFCGMGSFMAIMAKNSEVSLRAYSQSAGYAEQALSAVRIVVSFGQEQLEMSNYNRFLIKVRDAGRKQGVSAGLSLGFFFCSIYLTYAYSFTIGCVWIDEQYWNHTEDRIYSAGDTMVVFFGVLIGLFALGGTGPAVTAIILAKTAGKTAYEVMDREPMIKQDDETAQKVKVDGEIEFQGVDFIYPSRPDQKILDNMNITFKKGTTTALVGPSGSGKSTFIQLVERFYDPAAGKILIDGKDLKSINLRNYRQQIGYVGQEPVLFNTTVKQNILMGKPDATDAEIEEALRKTNSWDFVNERGGMNSQVGAGGGQLSGGQKQRLALARAFVKKPKMLIFDEATSALDKTNEAEVQRAIDQMKVELGGQVTTLVIAHRLSTVEKADRIVVLKKGRIVQDGTHDTLKQEAGSLYHKMVSEHEKSQAKEQANMDASAAVEAAPVAALERKNSLKRQGTIKKEDEFTDKDPAAIAKYHEAEKNRLDRIAEEDAAIDDLLNEKKNDEAFKKAMSNYAKPGWKVVVGCIGAGLTGAGATFFGWFLMEVMTQMNVSILTYQISNMMHQASPLTTESPELNSLSDCGIWIIVMVIVSLSLFIFKGGSGMYLAHVAAEILLCVRTDLYEAIMRKEMGWHDLRENTAGVMTSVLASDVQLLNGVSSDALQAQVESNFALLTAIIGGFIFSWPMALVGLGITPFIVICGAIVAKADNANFFNVEEQEGTEDKTDDQINQQILASDSIANFKTVASFGNDQILIDEYESINLRMASAERSAAICYALALGISVGVQNGVFAAFYFASSELYAAWPDYEYTQPGPVWNCMFMFVFGAFTAGQAISMGPDVAKAKRAALKIFKIIRLPSHIDVCGDDLKTKKAVTAETFQGKIEFKDVWFRYPARLNQWIFKGLNLTIEAQEAVAIVGESGQGKSTFIGLVMRFYDPEFGTVLIDGVDVREYNVVQLRERLGLVMQEPQLFNYNLKENILYGKLKATNAQIDDAALAANCKEFIEGADLSQAFDDDPAALLQNLESDKYKSIAIEKMGQQGFEEAVRILNTAVEKAQKAGKFEAIADLVDTRTDSEKGSVALHKGFDVLAGNKGSKLSGGQKQRIAIARAIVRQPSILLLDEATSALDENSQRLVQEALKGVMKGRTSIVVAHRLTTVQECSRLAVIENGVITETDTFDNLLNQGGAFAKLAKGMKKAEGKKT